jgi:outer membrane biosynthesis protein TonB
MATAATLAIAAAVTACQPASAPVAPTPATSAADGSPIVASVPSRPAADSAFPKQIYYSFQIDKQPQLLPGQGPVPYPQSLHDMGFQGQVLMQFVVDTSGRPLASTFKALRSSHALFTDAVRANLPEYRFSPGELHGEPVAVLVQMPFEFRIPR